MSKHISKKLIKDIKIQCSFVASEVLSEQFTRWIDGIEIDPFEESPENWTEEESEAFDIANNVQDKVIEAVIKLLEAK